MLEIGKKRSITDLLKFDLPLLITILVICIISLATLYSAKQNIALLEKQTIRFGIALLIMAVIAHIPVRVLQKWATALYILTLVMLVSVLLFGYISKGAQRWLNLGFIRFQPAEIMKIALPLMLANYLDTKMLPPKFSQILFALFLIAVPFFLVAMQPDLGTAILIGSTGIFILFFAGIPWKLIISACSAGIISAPMLWMFLHDYQKQRILTMLNPERDPLGTGYHIIQSKIAIGSGGMQGKGWLNGTQSSLEFLPERSTDFIFAVFGEEFGLMGSIALLAIYSIIVFRGLYIANQGRTTFSRLLAGSLTLTFFVYIFVNIGMVSGILPIVGIPLPLMSYGGTSILTLMIGFGILMAIKEDKSLLSR